MNRFPITYNVIFIFISFLYFIYTIFLSIMAPKVFCYCFKNFYVFCALLERNSMSLIHSNAVIFFFYFYFISPFWWSICSKKKCWKTTMWMYRYSYTAIEMWLVLRASISSNDKCMMWCDWVWGGWRRKNKFTIVVMSRVYVKALNYVFL